MATKKVIGISKIKDELYLIKYQIKFSQWFKKKTKIVERMAIKERNIENLPYRFIDDNRLVYVEDGYEILKWMDRHNIESFDPRTVCKEMQS